MDRVLVERIQAKTKTVGGIILPETAQARLNEGMIVATGPGIRSKDGTLIPLSVRVGQKVLLPEYGGNKVKLDEGDKEYVLFRDEDLLAVVSDDHKSK